MATTNSLANSLTGTWRFLSELSKITIHTDADSVRTSLSIGGDTAFSSVYYPDENGVITLYDFDKIVEPYMDGPFLDVIFLANGSYFVKVVRDAAEVREDAEYFVGHNFLSPVFGRRHTALGRAETLPVFVYTSADAVAECLYSDGQSLASAEVPLGEISGYYQIDVSPARFAKPELGNLVAYTIRCGQRAAEYAVDYGQRKPAYSVLFQNSFGGWEAAHFLGILETEPKYTRSTALIGGRLAQYDIEEELTRKASTGPMASPMAELFRDLARSKRVFLLEGGEITDELIVADADVKASNEIGALNTMSVTFRRASRRAADIAPVRPPRLFDRTFTEVFE